MKRSFKIAALTMALVLSVGMTAACGSNNDNGNNNGNNNNSAGAASASSTLFPTLEASSIFPQQTSNTEETQGSAATPQDNSQASVEAQEPSVVTPSFIEPSPVSQEASQTPAGTMSFKAFMDQNGGVSALSQAINSQSDGTVTFDCFFSGEDTLGINAKFTSQVSITNEQIQEARSSMETQMQQVHQQLLQAAASQGVRPFSMVISMQNADGTEIFRITVNQDGTVSSTSEVSAVVETSQDAPVVSTPAGSMSFREYVAQNGGEDAFAKQIASGDTTGLLNYNVSFKNDDFMVITATFKEYTPISAEQVDQMKTSFEAQFKSLYQQLLESAVGEGVKPFSLGFAFNNADGTNILEFNFNP